VKEFLGEPSNVAIVSTLFGAALGFTGLNKIWSALIPFLLFAVAVIYTEYSTPYSGGGASMWPIAVIVGGGLAAGSALGGTALIRKLLGRKI
jgi:hypothetical protein